MSSQSRGVEDGRPYPTGRKMSDHPLTHPALGVRVREVVLPHKPRRQGTRAPRVVRLVQRAVRHDLSLVAQSAGAPYARAAPSGLVPGGGARSASVGAHVQVIVVDDGGT